MAFRLFFLTLLALLPFLGTAEFHSKVRVGGDPDNTCVYTVYVRTGTVWKGGTDSTIGLKLADGSGGISIPDLEAWGGQMGAGYNYYERGNLDIFSGRGPCLSSVPCYLELISDGTGSGHGWYCNYVEVTITGPHLGCGQQLFTVEDWLATDRSPYNLTAVRDYCQDDSAVRVGARAGGHALAY